jgi:transcriptional regulator with XRE-family HTH domain
MSGLPAIGDVVREWRRYRQISLTEFSKRTKRSKGYISELEHNKIDNPKLDKLKRIAAALGISVRDIVSRRMPDEVNEGNVASEEDMQGLTLVKVEDGEAKKEEDKEAGGGKSGGVQPALRQQTQKTSSPRTLYDSLLSPSPQIILMRRLAVLEKKLATAEKNLHDAKEELRGLRALAADMQNPE